VECYRSIECIVSSNYTTLLNPIAPVTSGYSPERVMARVSDTIGRVGPRIVASEVGSINTVDKIKSFIRELGGAIKPGEILMDAVKGVQKGILGDEFVSSGLGSMLSKAGLFAKLFIWPTDERER